MALRQISKINFLASETQRITKKNVEDSLYSLKAVICFHSNLGEWRDNT